MAKGWGLSIKEQIQRGTMTYDQALIQAPHSSRSTKTKWRKAEAKVQESKAQ